MRIKCSAITMFLICCASLLTSAQKKERIKGEKPIIKSNVLNIGFMYGIGKPFNANYNNDLSTPLSFSQNINAYLKLKFKKISIFGGLRFTSFSIKKDAFNSSIESVYTKPQFKVEPNNIASTFELLTPYLGVGFHVNYKQIIVEPYMAFGVGFANYRLQNIHLVSQNSATLNETIFLNDFTSFKFINYSLGVNTSKKIFNCLNITSSLGFDFGTTDKSELQETTVNSQNNYLRKRNIYLHNSVSNLIFMFGFELHFYNRIFSNEKKYERIKKSVN